MANGVSFTCSKTPAPICRDKTCESPSPPRSATSSTPDVEEAQRLLERFTTKYQSKAPKLAAWAAEALPEGLAVFALPASHRRRLRTTNALERDNKEIKLRARVGTLFPNERSCERLVTAVVMEISEEWVTGRIYLNMEGEAE